MVKLFDEFRFARRRILQVRLLHMAESADVFRDGRNVDCSVVVVGAEP